jgi:glycosyltransferase involved in cell wall biosynthesis
VVARHRRAMNDATRRVNTSRITVVRGGLPLPAAESGERVVSDDDVRAWVLDGRIVPHLWRYQSARLLTERRATSGRPMLAWVLWLMARKRSYMADTEGRERDLTLGLLVRWSWQVAREAATKSGLLRRVERDVEAAEGTVRARRASTWDRSARVVYLRTDLSFGVRAGGSVGHIAGVLNEFAADGAPGPILMTTAPVPTVASSVEMHLIDVPERFWNFQELPTFVLNEQFAEVAPRVVAGRAVSFVYQRYSLNNFAGLRLAQSLGVPFVLEYNGSEIWMSRNWGRPLLYEALATRIELLNVTCADLVVVVSRAMRDELVARGIDADRVLVNPNAVDPERYSPAIDGAPIRQKYGLDGKTVLGFISTFQAWHGATVLARAFVELLAREPRYRDSVRLLMIGGGGDAETARGIIDAAGFGRCATFTGLVAQEDGPSHLAACDIFVSPHVPNADGTPFFGSPTKLFEYMAMARGIVASDLDQIGEVLSHGETAWLVAPGDVGALAGGLAHLIDHPDVTRALGAAARREVLAHHTWRAHVRRTLDALGARVGASAA